MLLPIDSLGIILTYKCSSRCRHCLYASGPEWTDFISREYLDSLLNGTKKIWKDYTPPPDKNILFHGIHFAGGEPFLNFPLLLYAVKKAKELGLYIGYVETNASWCINKEDVYEKFSLLKSSGLPKIFISCSPFHAEKIPLKRTLLAIETALEVFGPKNVIVYMEHFLGEIAKIDIENSIPLEKWIEIYGEKMAGYIFWEGYALIPGGRSGFYLGHLFKKYSAEVFREENCRFEILESQHAHFDLYGNYIPYFCGGLSLGKIEDLEEFYENFDLEKLPFVKILVEEGPYGLMKYAEKFGFKKSQEGYVGKCHLCVDVRRYINEIFPFSQELNPKNFYKYLI
ncbi:MULTISPECIES: radical SAM protein [Dictyoglomus]|jgi:MoaA/NifB/PqqE/SkfB family radical SAM enzyme|uniref:Radical SAM domain protein n=1 Tax=Dictyoglomus turgidum (strain DSM 6724 / Z-1310) TaxID=515635 RepID=B8E177_DICTD|nr:MULTISPECIES: radical SAM protein [Dictyoglomus]ACK42205.1 Radical SAM domain protein [Dictyoglomus turgidum DSM 6724]PNV79861.1 MAG: radical SAM protein [Dictyoglomus turgidum]HBU32435.1 radical SAM protein [Dictyoglomus sp.]